MAAIYKIVSNDLDESKLFWPAFKPLLEDKHGTSGQIGARGEDNAAKHLLNPDLFPELVIVEKREDAAFQKIGVDFITISKNANVNFIDVKSGSSALYYDTHKGWFITIHADWFDPTKKTDYFMHVGPKGDVFAIYKISNLLEWLIENPTLVSDAKYGKILYKKNWPDSIIYTNL